MKNARIYVSASSNNSQDTGSHEEAAEQESYDASELLGENWEPSSSSRAFSSGANIIPVGPSTIVHQHGNLQPSSESLRVREHRFPPPTQFSRDFEDVFPSTITRGRDSDQRRLQPPSGPKSSATQTKYEEQYITNFGNRLADTGLLIPPEDSTDFNPLLGFSNDSPIAVEFSETATV